VADAGAGPLLREWSGPQPGSAPSARRPCDRRTTVSDELLRGFLGGLTSGLRGIAGGSSGVTSGSSGVASDFRGASSGVGRSSGGGVNGSFASGGGGIRRSSGGVGGGVSSLASSGSGVSSGFLRGFDGFFLLGAAGEGQGGEGGSESDLRVHGIYTPVDFGLWM
jgi:hypothetical protein